MKGYYKKQLASSRLQKVYELSTARIRQYLKAELAYALSYINQDDLVLDLGCGYGRQFPDLCSKAGFVVGIDSSAESLALGKAYLKELSNFLLIEMSARKLLFPDESFDVVLCLQNGISAFHIDKQKLILEAIRVTKRGGTILFTSYSKKIWEERLKWFQLQSEAGLLGPIDDEKTGNGNIVCTDGFTASTVDEEMFRELINRIPEIHTSITEVDNSSIFCAIKRI
ncbi:MAG: class I SAM-dependent methyltransferase [Bacteroidales bacterium]|nr:class I SAM-dependent methyltransferase [Bacteroidota bacterium]MBL6949151.1 class I SAM-dependent methyltransferase [Bacteroidales bacterium]